MDQALAQEGTGRTHPASSRRAEPPHCPIGRQQVQRRRCATVRNAKSCPRPTDPVEGSLSGDEVFEETMAAGRALGEVGRASRNSS